MTQRNITLTLTDAGRAALINASSNAANVQFTAIELGSGTVALDNTAISLTHQQEQQPIFSSSSPAPGQLSVSSLFNAGPAAQYGATELGLIGDGVLFGVWSTTDPTQALVVRTPGVPYTATITVGYAQLPSQNISVVIQPLDAAVQALLSDTMTNTINIVFERLAPIVDTGNVNAYAAANVVPLTAATLIHGVRQRVVIKNTSTGAATYSPDGLPPAPIIGLNLSPLQRGELIATETAELEYVVSPVVNSGNGTWLLVRCGGGALQISPAVASAQAAQLDQVQSGASAYAADSGAANTYVVSYTPNVAGVTEGAVRRFKVKTANTGASTLQENALPAGPFVGAAGLPLQGGELVANGIAGYTWSSKYAAYVLLWCTGGNEQVPAATQPGHAVNLGQFGSSVGVSGYQKLPNGLIVQWGAATSSGTTLPNLSWTFPLAWPNQLAAISALPGGSGSIATLLAQTPSLAKVAASLDITNSSGAGLSAVAVSFLAIGY